MSWLEKNMPKIEQGLTQEQPAEGQKRAREFAEQLEKKRGTR